MEILMIIPKYTYNNLSTKPNYNYSFPIGLGYILSVLKKAMNSVDCLNLNHYEGRVVDLLINRLDKKKYDVVFTGGMALDYEMIETIVNIIKNHDSKPKIVVGGMIITSEPILMTKNLDYDIGVIGEGEETVIEIVDVFKGEKNLRDVRGICYKDRFGEVMFTEPRKLPENLDKLPYPDFEGIGFEKLLDNMSASDVFYGIMDYPRTYTILGSRGCPFNCTFCYHGTKYRERSVDKIMKELEFAIEKYKINSFNLLDDLFSINRERLNEFCDKIKKLGEKFSEGLKWRCSLWVGAADEEMLKRLKDAGCMMIGWGFESYSSVVLKSMKKPITPQQIDSAIKACLKLKIPIEGNFIFGDVAETKETARETLDYWKANCKGQVKLFFIHPYPGSEIYHQSIKKGIIKDKMDFIKNHMRHTNIVNMTKDMTDEEFNELVKEIYYLKKKYEKYVVPNKIKKNGEKRYELYIKCPFCNEEMVYKNLLIKNPLYYSFYSLCRNPDCHMRFFIVSRLYKFTVDYYVELDFLRKNYLRIRDNVLKKRL